MLLYPTYTRMGLLLISLLCSTAAAAQKISPRDSARITAMLPRHKAPDKCYIGDYTHELTVRVFGSRKFTSYSLHDKAYAKSVRYRPNSPFNIGAGINYRMIGLNLGFNLPLINDTKEHGKTRFLDLQTHIYGRKLLVDFYGQYYKGYYIERNTGLPGVSQPYIRPDLRTWNVGAVGQYLVNGDQFSFKAAYQQNEVQKKSAGSLILGGAVNNVVIKADSSIIPGTLGYENFFNNNHFNESSIQSLTFNAGYAYTRVLPCHFFVTGSILGGMGVNYSTIRNTLLHETAHSWGNELNATFRFALGYNSRRYFAGIHYVATLGTSASPIPGARQNFGSGNFRVSIATRLPLRKKLLGFY